jgi:4-hydroxybenzoate polyprenyltransferase
MTTATAPSPPLPARPREAPLWHRRWRRLEEYAQLARLEKPIGNWLLMWPARWALWVAGEGRPAPRVLLVFVAGVFVMRALGCVINDFADRDIDPGVRRTRSRPLAARRASPYEALALIILLAACALWLVTRLDRFTVLLSLVGAGLTLSYPFMKRFFPLPQLYLGISFGGWSVPMAFAAQQGSLPRLCWVMFIAAVLWAVIYDTLYAMVDREDDLKIGVRSTAITFADMDRIIIGILQALMLVALALVGHTLNYGSWYWGGLASAAATFLWQQWLVRAREPQACLRAFQNNNYTGMVIFIGILLQHLYG